MKDLHPNFKLWVFSDDRDGVMGDGKMHLLTEIDRLGSLSSAAKKLKISYRKAWGDLKKAELCMQTKLIEKTRGGKGGGQTELTETGRRLIEAYKRFRDAMTDSMGKAFEELRKEVLG